MSTPPRIILDHKTFLEHFHTLTSGDIVWGRMPMRSHEQHLLLDLSARGVHLIPSATSQMASRSKTFQARIFSPWMVPHTRVIYTTSHLLEMVNYYGQQKINKVILKHDKKNAGMGILIYSNIEDIYNQAANNMLQYPFVIQPFVEECKDIRVIILDDYIEAYTRSNPHNFRNNLHCGGDATPCKLSEKTISLCKEVMRRGDFPYCHLDLMTTVCGDTYLAEINLRGGMRGARIGEREYKDKVAAIEKKQVQQFEQ